MANARKEPAAEPATAPEPVTAPVVAPDVAWAKELEAKRDAALIEEKSKQNDLIAREGYYERERQRLADAEAAEVEALKKQIDQQIAIQASCQAALAALNVVEATNVVPMAPRVADDGAPIPSFLGQKAEVSPAA